MSLLVHMCQHPAAPGRGSRCGSAAAYGSLRADMPELRWHNPPPHTHGEGGPGASSSDSGGGFWLGSARSLTRRGAGEGGKRGGRARCCGAGKKGEKPQPPPPSPCTLAPAARFASSSPQPRSAAEPPPAAPRPPAPPRPPASAPPAPGGGARTPAV